MVLLYSLIFAWRRFGQNMHYFTSREKEALVRMLYEMWNSCTSDLPNTCSREQHESNQTKTQKKRVRREESIWKEVHRREKNKSWRSNCSSGRRPPRVSSPKAADELPNENNLCTYNRCTHCTRGFNTVLTADDVTSMLNICIVTLKSINTYYNSPSRAPRYITYNQDTWILGVVSKQLGLLRGRVWNLPPW